MTPLFAIGDRVQFNTKGRATYPKTPPDRTGVVSRVAGDGYPHVRWDGLRASTGPYHPALIEKVEKN